ncbi:MAG: hypothetical protein IKS59_02740 [Aeriscardovia sp.]|nr:hypothetical protein [Aeriscardovia sp.]
MNNQQASFFAFGNISGKTGNTSGKTGKVIGFFYQNYCVIFTMDKAIGKNKNTSQAAESIFFCKRITVNETSACDCEMQLQVWRFSFAQNQTANG